MTSAKPKIDVFPLKYHLIYWVGNVVLWVLFMLLTDGIFVEPLVNKLCYLPSQMIVTYAFLYYLLPDLFSKRWIKFLITLLGTTYIATILARFTKIYIYETVLGHDSPKESIGEIVTQLPPLMGQYMIWVFITPVITILGILIFNHLKEKEKVESLKKEKNIAELNFLKAQVHPHFLFNTMNNLYTLAVQESPRTKVVANKLSNILEYMLYKCNTPKINLEEEVKLLENYIDLEKIRYGNKLAVHFNTNIQNGNTPIAPLILLSLVENAFKHGTSNAVDNSTIDIHLEQENNEVIFTVFNTKPKILSADTQGYRKGIGSKNVERQLALIYKDKYQMHVENEESTYSVKLKIQLS